MTKYCPVCFSEFREKITICPKDQVQLLAKKPKEMEELLDIYAASGEIEAERIISFLRDEGVLAEESRSNVSQIPATSDTFFTIAVLSEQVSRAKQIIKQARADGVISENGSFL